MVRAYGVRNVSREIGCYKSKYGDLKICPVNIEELHQKAIESLPEKPSPPIVAMTRERFTIKESLAAAKLSEKRGIPIDIAEEEICKQFTFPDDEDEDYLRQLNNYNYLFFLVLSGFVINNGVLLLLKGEYKRYEEHADDGNERALVKSEDFYVLHMILGDMEERNNLYKFIARNSQMTWEGVLEAGRTIGATRFGKPILEVSSANSGQEAQPLIAIALAAATQYGIHPLKYKEMSVVEQEHIVAQYLTQRWLEHWAYEDRKKEIK